MFTTRPSPASRMSGRARRARRIGARVMVSSAARASASPTSSTAPVNEVPALFTSPKGWIRSTTRLHDAASVTSRRTVRTSTPASRAASRTGRALAWDRTVPTTSKPRPASSTTVAKPIPEFAPVTRTVFGSAPIPLVLPKETVELTLVLGLHPGLGHAILFVEAEPLAHPHGGRGPVRGAAGQVDPSRGPPALCLDGQDPEGRRNEPRHRPCRHRDDVADPAVRSGDAALPRDVQDDVA